MSDLRERRELTLGEYVRRRNGVPMGAKGSLRNMLHRSLGAGSFAGFWRYWNPIFGYFLGSHVFQPLKKVMPPPPALVLTFVVCGAIHDLVGTLAKLSPLFYFIPWFFFLGLGVVIGEMAKMDLSGRPWVVRAGANLAYVAACWVLAMVVIGRI